MARSLEQLQKQYNSAAAAARGMMPGGGRSRALGAKGKPKNTAQTIKRLLSYLKGYRVRLIVVLICMLVSTVTSLCGSYLMAPIINRLTREVSPDTPLKMSGPERVADGIIQSFTNGKTDAMSYIMAAVLLLAAVYTVGILTSYIHSRMMLRKYQNMEGFHASR